MNEHDDHKRNGSENRTNALRKPPPVVQQRLIRVGSAARSSPASRSNLRRRVTVCHLSDTLDTGGLERLLAGFARLCDRSRFRLSFVAMDHLGRFAEEIRRQYWPVCQLRARTRLQRVRELVRFLRRWNVDILHAHNTYPHVYGTVASRLGGVPIVVSTRHEQRLGHTGRLRTAYRWASRFVDRVVAVSDDAADLCTQADGIDPERIVRISNGIDLEGFSYSGSNGQPVAIYIGRLSPEKDVPTLLKAVRCAVQQVPNIQLRVVGDGPERIRLRRLCGELGLNENIRFLGQRTDVSTLLAEAGLFVSSSITEGPSLTLLEAMAVGLPVIATRVGGNEEVVEEGLTGRLVPPGNPHVLAEAMIDLCRTPKLGIEMGRRARQRVTQHYDIRRTLSEYETLYRQLMHAVSPHGRSIGRWRSATAEVR